MERHFEHDAYGEACREWMALSNLHEKLMARSDDGDQSAFQLAREMIPELEAAHHNMLEAHKKPA